MAPEPTIDAEFVEEKPAAIVPVQQELAPLTPDEGLRQVHSFEEYKGRFFKENPHLVQTIQGRQVPTRKAWELLARGQRLSIELLSHGADGKPGASRQVVEGEKEGSRLILYSATARVHDRHGAFVDATGFCSSKEKWGANENTMAQMACKRARAKAIDIFFGGEGVAEEEDEDKAAVQEHDSGGHRPLGFMELMALGKKKGVIRDDDGPPQFLTWLYAFVESTIDIKPGGRKALSVRECAEAEGILRALPDK